ncbi:MAG TPA: hemolysin family protein [Terriglobales bacterium]|nr:hemolysin family protein [Terriglobales bacterium]
MTLVLLRVFLVFVLIFVNAFFVAAEFALVSVRDTRLDELLAEHRLGARTVQKLQQNLGLVLAAVQLGVTVASLGLGWIGEATVAYLLEPAFRGVPYARLYAHGIAVAVAFLLITYLLVTLGELVPKALALQRAERVALAVAGPMDFFISMARPFLHLMRGSARLALRPFGLKQLREAGVHSPEEIKLIVTASRRVGLIPALPEEMVHRALELGNLTVRQIMVPRPQIFSLPADLPLEDAMARVVEEQHSRVPVYDPQRGPEHIVGVLYSKDLSRVMQQRLVKLRAAAHAEIPAGMTVRHIMRQVLVVPDTKELPDLLQEFKQRKRHLAVVVDEFGSTVGVVTVEDVLEQIVGELEDEFDAPEQAVIPLAAGGAVVLDGNETIRDLEVQYQLALPHDQGFETLGGFILSRLQRIPRGGESFDYRGRRFTVLQMDGHRVARVKVEAVAGTPPANPAERAAG